MGELTNKKIKEATAELKKILGEKGKFQELDFDNFLNYSPVFYDENLLWWAWKTEKKCWCLVDEITITNLFGDFCHLIETENTLNDENREIKIISIVEIKKEVEK